jgi:hypothetical protein
MLRLSDLTLGVNESVSSGLFDLWARLEQTWQAMTPASTTTSAKTSLLKEGDLATTDIGRSPARLTGLPGLLQTEMYALASASTMTVVAFLCWQMRIDSLGQSHSL